MTPRRPESATRLESLYSNFGHEIDVEVETSLKTQPNTTWAPHTALNFFANVWFDGIKWHSDIWKYNECIDHLEGLSAIDVIRQANTQYGKE